MIRMCVAPRKNEGAGDVMKKFLAIVTGVLLLCAAQARAECWYGMIFNGRPKNGDVWSLFACTQCSGGRCAAAVRMGASAEGCKAYAVTRPSCAQCVPGKTWDGKRCVCSAGTYGPSGERDKWAGGYIDTSLVPNLSGEQFKNKYGKCEACAGNFKVTSAVCTDCRGTDYYTAGIACGGSQAEFNAYCKPLVELYRLSAAEKAELEKIKEHQQKYGTYCTAWTCKAGYYKTNQDNGYCQPCSSVAVANGSCTACSNASTCTAAACNSGYGWNGSSCVKLSCPAGQYLNGGSCAACPSGQWSAGGTATSCQPCSSIGVANGKCTACSATGGCTAVSCNNGYKANGASCVQVTCPAGQRVSGASCAACPAGQWSAGGTATACQPCSSIAVANGTCTACSATGACAELSCARKYAFKNGACVPQKCFSNTYEDDSGACRPCSDIAVNGGVCSSCSYDGSVCESAACNEGWANDAAASCVPTKECSAGGFWDESSQSCKRCDTYIVPNGGCVECNASACTKAECDKAGMTFSESGQNCGVECAADQYLDASFECKACPSGQFSAGGRFVEATTCSSCSTIDVNGGTCVECSNGECKKASCSVGYRLDETGKKCLKNAANCMDGLSVTADGCCCAK